MLERENPVSYSYHDQLMRNRKSRPNPTRRILQQSAYILFIIVAFAGTACKRHSPQAPNVVRGMAIESSSSGSTYTLKINGEPVSYLDGEQSTLFIGYPIHGGTNQYVITVRFPSDFHSPHNLSPKIMMHIGTQESATGSFDSKLWDLEDHIMESWTVGDEYSYESDFVMSDAGMNTEFEAIGTNKDAYVAQCKLMSIKLAELVKRQDLDKLAGVFGLGADSFATNFAPLVHSTHVSVITNVFEIKGVPGSTKVLLHSTNVFEIECAQDTEALSAVTGDHLVLICSDLGEHLISFTNRKAHENWSHSESDAFHHRGAYYFDSFVLADQREGGKLPSAVLGGGT